jgi:hypothetical protein
MIALVRPLDVSGGVFDAVPTSIVVGFTAVDLAN